MQVKRIKTIKHKAGKLMKLSSETKVFITGASIYVLIMWLVINGVLLLIGCMDAVSFNEKNKADCHNEIKRLELLMPGHITGCWLMQPYGAYKLIKE